MKRLIHSLLAAAVLVSAMTCTAFAGDYSADQNDSNDFVGTIVTNDEGKSYTVSYDGATDGNQYVVLVVKKDADGTYDASKAANILYINQAAAADGKITFSNVIPMTSANAVVLLGGVFDGEESPVILGELKVPFVLGNVNEDEENTINTADALLILQHVVELATLSDTQLLAADVNGDGVANTADAIRILQYQVELIDYEGLIAPAN